MSPEHLLESAILEDVVEMIQEYVGDPPINGPFDTEEKIHEALEILEEQGFEDYVTDAESEMRDSFTHETGLGCGGSRHYESKGVAKLIGDQWVGWTYWFGGGKFGDPGAIDWMPSAYFLEAKEETRVVLTFTEK